MPAFSRFITAALILLTPAGSYSQLGGDRGCKDRRPVLDVTLSLPKTAGQFTKLYLPATVDEASLFPGIRLTLSSIAQNDGSLAFRALFDFDEDDQLLSTDYSIYRISYSLSDGEHLRKKEDFDFSDGCLAPQGHQLRAGEAFHAAKFSDNLSTYRFPRLRIVVWGGLF